MNLQEAMNYYDRYSDQMSALQTAPLSVMIFFGWLWALLARRKRK